VAKAYWKLPRNAKWVEAMKCMVRITLSHTLVCRGCTVHLIWWSVDTSQFADECHHRDVNHTFAELDPDEPNPFLLDQRLNALRHAALDRGEGSAWAGTVEQQAESTSSQAQETDKQQVVYGKVVK
jgi:nitrogen fixation-related uncharacterized protein